MRAKRGRKSVAELVTLSSVRHAPAGDQLAISSDQLQPPAHLTAETKAWWSAVLDEFDLQPYQLRTLQAAAEAWDLYQLSRCELAKHGLTFEDDKGMIRARPEAAIARDARTSFLRAMRELNLKIEPLNSGLQPPALFER